MPAAVGLASEPPAPRTVIFLLRWLVFRLMLLSGLVKLASGDSVGAEVTVVARGVPVGARMPYQTLIASVLHKYVTGRLAEKPARPASGSKGRGETQRENVQQRRNDQHCCRILPGDPAGRCRCRRGVDRLLRRPAGRARGTGAAGGRKR
mgnify:CR=1 FL=1